MSRLIVRWRDGYCNIPITHLVWEENIVWAFNEDEKVGFFDLGAVDVLYVSEQEERKWN